ncbi:hypothetical protein B0H14DRAFT_3074452 [Mycena olivaceomarginata]|nr:hypothetical protein B0H14DRAFT_3074452 [Mycena olivaceomarginata]
MTQWSEIPHESVENGRNDGTTTGASETGVDTQWTISDPPVSSLHGNVAGNARDAGALPGDDFPGDDLSSAFPALNGSDYEEVNSPQTQSSHVSSLPPAAITQWPDHRAHDQISGMTFQGQDRPESLEEIPSPLTQSNQAHSSSAQGGRLVDAEYSTTYAPRWKTPSISFGEESAHDFHSSIGSAHSMIREYVSPTEGVLYFVAAGRYHWGYIALTHQLSSFHDLATAFFAQRRDPALAQLVWGHGNVMRHHRGTLMDSRFIVTEKHVRGGDLVYDLVQPEGGELSLYHQLQLTRDYNFLRRPASFNALITYLGPLILRTREDMVLEYVYALLAVLHRLPKQSHRMVYLEHQEDYLNGAAYAEWSALSEANIKTCLQSGASLDDVLRQARERIRDLMKSFAPSVISEVVGLCPTLDHKQAALKFASSLYLWSMNTARAFALTGQEVNMTYIKQINPLRAALGAALQPALILARIEPEYVEYAQGARYADESHRDRPALPSTPISIARIA